MSDKEEILQKILLEYRQALIIKKLNQDLYHQLSGSLDYLLKYSEKYNIQIPKKEQLINLLKRSNMMIEDIERITNKNTDPTTFDTDKNRRRLDRI